MTKQKQSQLPAEISNDFYLSIYQQALRDVKQASQQFNDDIEQAVDAVLSTRTPTGLKSDQTALLLLALRNPKGEAAQKILDESQNLRKKLYQNKVAAMVPIEIGSYCSSNCGFCGWKNSNKEMLRLRVTHEALERQTEYLASIGFSHFELSGGDDLIYLRDHLKEAVQRVKQKAKSINSAARVSICLTPMSERQYGELAHAGLDTVLTWQETYEREAFNSYVTSGPKAFGIDEDFKLIRNGDGFLARLRSQENAVRAGLQVGIGCMLGLASVPEADILSVIIHGRKLAQHYGETMKPLIIGMPTWNPITTQNSDIRETSGYSFKAEQLFELVSAIYFLSFPDFLAWVFPNCRVSKETQIKSILTAGCFTSTMVRVGPGAYLPMDGKDLIATSNFERSSLDFEQLDDKKILEAEQFRHHFDTHDNYILKFAKNGLEVVNDSTFLK